MQRASTLITKNMRPSMYQTIKEELKRNKDEKAQKEQQALAVREENTPRKL
jgi:hypothetical protein